VPSDGYEQASSGPNKGLWFFTKPKVIDHEGFPNGYTPPPASHTGSLRAELNRRTPKVTEPIWSSVGEVDLESKATTVAQSEIDAAIKWSLDQRDGGSAPPVTYCTFKYF
jgi:hypothetical protein